MSQEQGTCDSNILREGASSPQVRVQAMALAGLEAGGIQVCAHDELIQQEAPTRSFACAAGSCTLANLLGHEAANVSAA